MIQIAKTQSSRIAWMLLALCIVTLFLFLGNTLFNTRGEPREAVVALSMLQEGNWVLPVNNGVDMAYKPPFFHWLAALCSLPLGHVTEYTARMPSAIAATIMVMAGFSFYNKRRGTALALIMALVTLSNFEVHRAAVACRVDMVLTCMMVLSLYLLYGWMERGMKFNLKEGPWCAILCLSGAFLSKGPVGAALPCLVVAVFGWVRQKGFFNVLWRLAVVGVLCLALPAVWYVAAYEQGGQRFLDLVYEENVLRLLGKMSYASHENPWPYNVMTLLTGFVPYTLLAFMALFVADWKQLRTKLGTPNQWWTRLKTYVKDMDDARLFSLLSFVIIFVFYCIPKSKRSVYLLPVYPFVAYFVAEFLLWLRHRHLRVLVAFGWTLATLTTLLTLTYVVVRMWLIPDSIVAHGKHAAQNIAMLNALRTEGIGSVIWAIPLVAVWLFVKHRHARPLATTFTLIFCLFFALDGVYQPPILNAKSDKPLATYIETQQPTGRVYSFRTDINPGNPLHPFTINFYLGDRVVPFEAFMPTHGLLIVGNDEIEAFHTRYPHYRTELVKDFDHKSCDDHKMLKLYRFAKA